METIALLAWLVLGLPLSLYVWYFWRQDIANRRRYERMLWQRQIDKELAKARRLGRAKRRLRKARKRRAERKARLNQRRNDGT